MKNLIFTTLLLFCAFTISAQNVVSSKDKVTMVEIVNEGLKSKPKSFFNKDTTYDYTSNIEILSVEVPEKQTFTGFEDRAASTFFCKVNYTMEGTKAGEYFKIMTRKDTTGKIQFYSATLWSEENVK